MKKVSFFFAALFVSALVLSSCTGSGSGDKKDSAAADSPKVEETVTSDSIQNDSAK